MHSPCFESPTTTCTLRKNSPVTLFTFWTRNSFFLAASVFSAMPQTIFVDDASPNVIYSPSDKWAQGATCGGNCPIKPNPTALNNQTWHYATYDPALDSVPPSITFTFTATSLVAHVLLPPLVPTAPTSHVEIICFLDGLALPPYSYDPSSSSDFIVSLARFPPGSSNLSVDHEHTVLMQMATTKASVLIFDCFEMTVPEGVTQGLPAPTSSPPQSSPTSSSPPTAL